MGKTTILGRHNAPGGAVRAFRMADDSYRVEIHGCLHTLDRAAELMLAIDAALDDVGADSCTRFGAM